MRQGEEPGRGHLVLLPSSISLDLISWKKVSAVPLCGSQSCDSLTTEERQLHREPAFGLKMIGYLVLVYLCAEVGLALTRVNARLLLDRQSW